MKLLVVLSSIFLVAYAIDPELLESIVVRVKVAGIECKTEIQASDDDIEPLKTHNPPTTTKGKCFLACMYEKMGSFDSEGKINPEGIRANLEIIREKDEPLYQKLKQVTETCLNLVKDDEDKCETAVQVMLCGEKEKKEVGVERIDIEY